MELIKPTSMVLFTLDEQRYALDLEIVERIVRAAAITPLPKSPEIVLGILDLHGEIIPVLNMRRRFRLPERDIRTTDQFIIARTGNLTVALAVDSARGVMEGEKNALTVAGTVLAGTEYVAGVTRTDDGLVLIHDLETFLTPGEEQSLLESLGKAC